MKKIFFFLLAVIYFITPNVFAASVNEGKMIFEKKCVMCHGDKAEGDIGPSLNCNALINKSNRWIFETIKRGRKSMFAQVDMPAWGSDNDIREKIDILKKLQTQLADNNKEVVEKIQYFINKFSAEMIHPKDKNAEKIVKKFGSMSDEEINSIVMYLRSFEQDVSCIDSVEIDVASAQRGKKLFNKNCINCHGVSGKGLLIGGGLHVRDLTDPIYIGSREDEELFDAIKYGAKRGVGRSAIMQAFPKLSDKEIDDLISYIGSIAK